MEALDAVDADELVAHWPRYGTNEVEQSIKWWQRVCKGDLRAAREAIDREIRKLQAVRDAL